MAGGDDDGRRGQGTWRAIALLFGASCGAGLVLAVCYWLARMVLDRRRLAAWESDWALTGPRWTTRQG